MLLLVLAAAAVSTPYAQSDSSAWSALLKKTCPTHHVEWMAERSKDDLADQFFLQLPLGTQGALHRLADTRRTCANAELDNANYCEFYTDIHALRRLRILGEFAAYACSQAVCSDPAACEKPHAAGRKLM